MNRFLFGAALSLSLFNAEALADTECGEDVYQASEIIADMQNMESSIIELNDEKMKKVGARIVRNVQCMLNPAPPQVYAKLYRYIGVYYQISGNLPEANRWYRTALELNPSFTWDPKEIPSDHPIRLSFEQQRNISQIDETPLEGYSFLLPEGKTVVMDGRDITMPFATEARPHLVALVDIEDRSIQARFLINGNQFPDSILQKSDGMPADNTDDLFSIKEVDRMRPPIKTPMLVMGGIALATASGIYGYTFETNRQFDEASTTTDMLEIQNFNNTLVITSGIVGFVGVGIGYAGIMIDSEKGFWPFNASKTLQLH